METTTYMESTTYTVTLHDNGTVYYNLLTSCVLIGYKYSRRTKRLTVSNY